MKEGCLFCLSSEDLSNQTKVPFVGYVRGFEGTIVSGHRGQKEEF